MASRLPVPFGSICLVQVLLLLREKTHVKQPQALSGIAPNKLDALAPDSKYYC